MITPTHDNVDPPFGSISTHNFLVLVDEHAGISEIIEQYTRRGSISGDTINRWGARSTVFRNIRDIEAAGLYGNHP
jgi:hypothetical protein